MDIHGPPAGWNKICWLILAAADVDVFSWWSSSKQPNRLGIARSMGVMSHPHEKIFPKPRLCSGNGGIRNQGAATCKMAFIISSAIGFPISTVCTGFIRI
jgi:hypothetical protein